MVSKADRAGRSPVNEFVPILIMVGTIGLLVIAPSASARLWSDTSWRPEQHVTALIDAYRNLFHPERIDASGMSGYAFGATTIALIVGTVIAVAFVSARIGRNKEATNSGFATGAELDNFSKRSIIQHSDVILGHQDKDPSKAGLMVGTDVHSGKQVWLTKESTVLVLAPPRSGKTTGTIAPAVVDHYGPVVVTGVRRDILDWTHPFRATKNAPMWLCEPTLPSNAKLPDGVRQVRWSPVAGCDSLLTAKLRAEALFAVIDKGGANDEFWRNAGQTLLSAYLLAAASHDGTIADVLGWVDRDSDRSPAEVLRNTARNISDPMERATISSLADQVEASIERDPRYKAGVTGQMLQALEPFRLPEIRAMTAVTAAESFDPHQFLKEQGTIWMLGSVSHQKQAAGVCTALTAAIVEAARDLSNEVSRLQPPLLLALDEAVNVAPIPRLDQLLSTGGGSGMQTIVVLQSLAAARNAWGREMGDALLDFNNAKIVLGGLSDADDLEDISRLLGQREERVVQASRSGRLGLLDAGDYSWSWRQVPVLRPDEIRRIDSEKQSHALMIARSGSPILVRQQRIYERDAPGARR